MSAPIDNETWLIEAGDDVIQKKAAQGVENLSAVEKLIYCFWVADYGMRNAGDLETARDWYSDFQAEGAALSKKLKLEQAHSAFSLSTATLEMEYFDRFEAICDDIRQAAPPHQIAAKSQKTATPMSSTTPKLETLRWIGDHTGHLELIEQTLLPQELKYLACRDAATVFEAIRALRVRGAPAIGMAAAYGVVIGTRDAASGDEVAFHAKVEEVAKYLAESRPTAVNLFWALDRMRKRAAELRGQLAPRALHAALLDEARAIHEEDRSMCHAIGRLGAALIGDNTGVLTHCNAGGLATAEYGTALSVLFTAQDQGKQLRVFVDETRPLLQGARLTAWELSQRGIDTTLICDNMAAQVMREGKVQAVIVGADRITANGDTANKIGTYGVALLAKAHDIPFYVAAPTSTFDLSLETGDSIPIEERHAAEITHGFGRQTAPTGVRVYNPAFDVTPAKLIKAIITDRGVIEPVTKERVAAMVGEFARK